MPKKTEEEWEARLGTSSFNPLDILLLQDAVREEAKEVFLSDGRKFNLTYYINNKEQMVYYSPDRAFAPCGHLIIRHLLRGI